jgi:hypothetical protein
MRKTPLLCPKCHKFPAFYRESIACYADFDVDADGWPSNEGIHGEGDYFKVEAYCSCGHTWRIKGATQITDVRPEAGREGK